jgi:hypothetical protein
METARKTVARMAASLQYARDHPIWVEIERKIKVLDSSVLSAGKLTNLYEDSSRAAGRFAPPRLAQNDIYNKQKRAPQEALF